MRPDAVTAETQQSVETKTFRSYHREQREQTLVPPSPTCEQPRWRVRVGPSCLGETNQQNGRWNVEKK